MNPALLVVALAAVAAPAPAEEEIKLPQGPQPLQVLARMTKEGRIEITEQIMEARTEKRTRTTVVDGREVPVEYVVTTVKSVPRTRLLPEKGVKAYTAAGKEVDPKDLPDKLKKPAVVLMSWDGNKVDPFFLRVVKPDTLVLVPPVEAVAPADGGAKPPPLPETKPIPKPRD
jgi:hypothetical protein